MMNYLQRPASSSAVAGKYKVEVSQLAQAARIRSNDFTSETEIIGTGDT